MRLNRKFEILLSVMLMVDQGQGKVSVKYYVEEFDYDFYLKPFPECLLQIILEDTRIDVVQPQAPVVVTGLGVNYTRYVDHSIQDLTGEIADTPKVRIPIKKVHARRF